MTFLDFFSGIGTIRMGLEQCGFICRGRVEIDKQANKVYELIHDTKGEEFFREDIKTVKWDEIPSVALWSFGAPCQDFSIAGERYGLGGDRSSLIGEIIRLLEETPQENKPRWLLYENVKGMLSSNKGLDFLAIILRLDELGYDLEWQTINSKDYGVPQSRERVYLVGHLRGRGFGKILPIKRESSQIKILQIATTISDKRDNPNRYRVYDKNGLSPTLGASMGGGRQPCIVEGDRIRKITPKEYFRLQGIPDEYYEKVRDTQKDTALYRFSGNACTVNVIKAIGERLLFNSGA